MYMIKERFLLFVVCIAVIMLYRDSICKMGSDISNSTNVYVVSIIIRAKSVALQALIGTW